MLKSPGKLLLLYELYKAARKIGIIDTIRIARRTILADQAYTKFKKRKNKNLR